jgi:hypothetical protein
MLLMKSAKGWSPLQKDAQLREVLAKLHARGVRSKWTTSTQPFTGLWNECAMLVQDAEFCKELDDYLRVRTTIPRAVEMLFTTVAMAATADWKSAPEEYRGIGARGWFIGRWLPTFLIIDGPLGRLLDGDDSPLKHRYGQALPLFTGARDLVMDRTFRLIRNSLAHWSFHWKVVGSESYLVAYDWERDLPQAKLHLSEADAYHLAAFAVVEILHDVILKRGVI